MQWSRWLKSVSESVSDPLTLANVNVIQFTKNNDYKCNTIIFSSSATIYDPSQSFPVSESGK